MDNSGVKKIIVAMDSFKGSMSSIEAGNAIKDALLEMASDYNVHVFPVADGGEGTVEALTYGKNKINYRKVKVTGPIGDKVEASYVIYEDDIKKTAVIEMASAAGLALVPYDKRNPMYTTTYGVGELIEDAINEGCRHFIVGIGGSATNDAGIGMLQALGYHFYDKDGREVAFGNYGVAQIADVGFEDVNPIIRDCKFNVICDVNNPLTGENGCTYIYAPQKGADEGLLTVMDKSISRFADLTEHIACCDMSELKVCGNRFTEGTGAAGGLGYAFLMYLNAGLMSGVDIVLSEINIESSIKEADLVITGEGRLDGQTLMGKTPFGVARIAKKYNKAVYVYAGCFGDGIEACISSGLFDGCYSITNGMEAYNKEELMKKENAINNLKNSIKKTCFT